MNVLDKVEAYSRNQVTSSVFDVNNPEGLFLQKLHNQGYRMYWDGYKDTVGNFIYKEQYNKLSDSEKANYSESIAFTELHDMLVTQGNQLVVANAGSGKALANNVKVLTPEGYTEIGKLKVGDLVIGTDLKPYKVLGVHPQGKKQVNNIEFCFSQSGSQKKVVIPCCEQHLWGTLSKGNQYEVYSTKDIKRMTDAGRSIALQPLSSFNFSEDVGADILMSKELKNDILLNFLFRYVDSKEPHLSLNIGDKDVIFHFTIPYKELDFVKNLVAYLGIDFSDFKFYRNELEYATTSEFLHKPMTYDNYSPDFIRSFCTLLFSTEVDTLRLLLNGMAWGVEVRKVETTDTYVNMTCIEVSSDNHLFLIDSLIPTHNTTSLIFKIMHDIITGESTVEASVPNGKVVNTVDKIFVGTFLKTGAEELRERLSYWQKVLGYATTSNVTFSTLHAEFMRALNAMGASTPIGKTDVISKCMRTAINNLGISRNGDDLKPEDYNVIASIITFYRGRLDDSKYTHPSVLDYNLTPIVLDKLVSDFAVQRQLNGIIDYEDLQELLYRFLYVTPNPAVQDFISSRYNYVYLDELQDTSQIQYAILKFYARGKLWMNQGTSAVDSPLCTGLSTRGKIVGVGDPDQCIYRWRGSDNSIIEDSFDADFRPTLSGLSVNYRCPVNILGAVVPSIKRNSGHKNRNYLSASSGGTALAYKFANYDKMVSNLINDLDEDMADGDTVAILCRTNYDGVIPALVLCSSGHYDFSIGGNNMTLDSPLPRKLINMATLFTEKGSPAVKASLTMLVSRSEQWKMKQLTSILKNNHMSIWDVCEADLEYSCEELADIIKDVKSKFYINGVRDQTKEISALDSLYVYLSTNVFDGNSLFCESARAYISSLRYIISSNNFENAFDYLDFVNMLNDKMHGSIGRVNAKISIATVHEFKGKERDSVIVWNDSEGVFPSSKTDLKNIDQVEDERRVHYVACTRAKKKLRVYSLMGKASMFLNEMRIPFAIGDKIQGSLSRGFEKLTEEEKNLIDIMNSLPNQE